MKKANIITSLICIVFSLAVIIYSWAVFPKGSGGVPGPAVFPILIACMMLLSGLVILVDAIRTNSDEKIVLLSKDNIRVYISMGIMLAYCVMVPVVGFVVSSVIFLTVTIRWFSQKKIWVCLAWAAAMSGIVYAVFTYLLKVSLKFGFLI